jgi:hypothetical protein
MPNPCLMINPSPLVALAAALEDFDQVCKVLERIVVPGEVSEEKRDREDSFVFPPNLVSQANEALTCSLNVMRQSLVGCSPHPLRH